MTHVTPPHLVPLIRPDIRKLAPLQPCPSLIHGDLIVIILIVTFQVLDHGNRDITDNVQQRPRQYLGASPAKYALLLREYYRQSGKPILHHFVDDTFAVVKQKIE